ncbi:vitamin K-dependent protein S-like [Acipenser ruthenus]|uniref:vitamin K-dependent protein S-like n=1 Tax=Acipenser ruthenus TaxID=7906 RepID=UPI002740E535|nr:vitamin K-dependent protein S-like [Acipenser ruthenus]
MWRKKMLFSDSLGCLFILLLAFCETHQFLSQRHASQFLTRRRRANSLFEESKKGNLERECIEELCNKEEAREVFENDSETEYFYPKYVACLGSHRVGILNSPLSQSSEAPATLRSCVKEISNQCSPLPCYRDGYEKCVDGKGRYECICKPGWRGERCEEDINECEDPEALAACNQKCYNYPGGFRCLCEDGYYLLTDQQTCTDFNECVMYPSICGSASCVNTPGKYVCACAREGYRYNFTSQTCEDINECEENICEQSCVNSRGSYSCYCNGTRGMKLAKDMKSCEPIPICIPLKTARNSEMLYLGEQFVALPVVYLRFRLPEITKFAAEFDLRTFDPEGVILYAESSQNSSWFMVGLRDGKIEIQYKNQHSVKITSGGKAINNGQWHCISVEELEKSISVKIAKEAVMSISSPESLFHPIDGILETKLYIAGLPRPVDSLVKSINPRLDGCIRAWNLMNQGGSGVKGVIQEKENKHCLVEVERGSYFPGSGMAHFRIDYKSIDGKNWTLSLKLNIRPSTSTGVIFALASGETVPLSVAIVDSDSPNEQEIAVFIENVKVTRLKSVRLCYPGHLEVELEMSSSEVQIKASSFTAVHYTEPPKMEKQLSILDAAMEGQVDTYVGGIPDVPVTATPVSAFYNGCIEIEVNGQRLDFDEAVLKHNDIKSHSCPPF